MLAQVQPKLALLPKIFQRLQWKKLFLAFHHKMGERWLTDEVALSTQGRPRWLAEAPLTGPGWDLNPELSDSSFFLLLATRWFPVSNLEVVFLAPWSKEGPSKPLSPTTCPRSHSEDFKAGPSSSFMCATRWVEQHEIIIFNHFDLRKWQLHMTQTTHLSSPSCMHGWLSLSLGGGDGGAERRKQCLT